MDLDRNVEAISQQRGHKRKLSGAAKGGSLGSRQCTSSGVYSITTPSTDVDLCETCRSTEFPAMFNKTSSHLPNTGLIIMNSGRPENLRKTCPMCCLFNVNRRRDRFQLRLFSNSTLFEFTENNEQPAGASLLVVDADTHPLGCRRTERQGYIERGIIMPAIQDSFQTGPQSLYGGYRIDAACASYTRMKEWLRQCPSLHGESCSLSGVSIPMQIKCIDCASREIVQIDQESDYICLSYVCKLATVCSLTVCLPNTVNLRSSVTPFYP